MRSSTGLSRSAGLVLEQHRRQQLLSGDMAEAMQGITATSAMVSDS
jgi:hypothetical protein